MPGVIGCVLMILALAGCGGKGDASPFEQGRRIYVTSCTACHHLDPALDGTLGPAIAGSSRDLIEARVLRAEYPDGYAPKRATSLMTPLPYLAPHLEVLVAYLSILESD